MVSEPPCEVGAGDVGEGVRMGMGYEVLIGGVAVSLRGMEVSAVKNGEDGERRDWVELGVTGVGEEVAVEQDGRCSGRGEFLVA